MLSGFVLQVRAEYGDSFGIESVHISCGACSDGPVMFP